jgi:transposase
MKISTKKLEALNKCKSRYRESCIELSQAKGTIEQYKNDLADSKLDNNKQKTAELRGLIREQRAVVEKIQIRNHHDKRDLLDLIQDCEAEIPDRVLHTKSDSGMGRFDSYGGIRSNISNRFSDFGLVNP